MQKRIVNLIAFIIVIGSSFYLGTFMGTNQTVTEDNESAAFLEVMNELIDNHFSQPGEEALWEGAIDGMIDALDDPYTSYFDYEEYSQYQSNFGETYVGIGISVTYNNGLIIVEEVKSDGPADGAGIEPNDIIAYVDGENVQGENYYEIISNIIGDEGTDVTIGIIRAGIDDVIYLTMTRAVIDNSSINYETFTSGDKTIGYIEVTTFGDETSQKFHEAIIALEEVGIDGLVVDLRNNGGGHLYTVYNMLNEFLIDNGKEMFSTEYYVDGEFFRQEYDATNTVKKDYNIVTLVNGNSASASEVFASSMQEHGGYPVIGTTTFGKGTMQTDEPIDATVSDSVHITIGKWITCNGNWIHYDGGTGGVTPDVEVLVTDNEKAYKLFLQDDEVLEYDTVDDRIANMQLILNIMGYSVRTDGYYDLETKDAIMDIQTNNSLTADGVVDSDTLGILNTALDAFRDDPLEDSQLQASITYLVENPLDE